MIKRHSMFSQLTGAVAITITIYAIGALYGETFVIRTTLSRAPLLVILHVAALYCLRIQMFHPSILSPRSFSMLRDIRLSNEARPGGGTDAQGPVGFRPSGTYGSPLRRTHGSAHWRTHGCPI